MCGLLNPLLRHVSVPDAYLKNNSEHILDSGEFGGLKVPVSVSFFVFFPPPPPKVVSLYRL